MKKKKRIRKFALRTRFLINNQIDSVSLLELELVEKSKLNGSYFLSARSLCWSMFKAFAISFLSLVKVSEYFLKAQFSMKHDIETRKKRIRKLKLRTRFLISNQIDSVSLLELELVEKSNLNGSYFLSARSLCWSMFKAFAISFLSLVKVSEYFLKAQFSMKHDIETRKKRIHKLKLWTRFLTFNNQIGFI